MLTPQQPSAAAAHPSTPPFQDKSKKAQVSGKGPGENRTLYTGMEVIQTGGGPQLMKVVYKRGARFATPLPYAQITLNTLPEALEKSQVKGKEVNESYPLYTGMEMVMTDQGPVRSVSARVMRARACDPYTATSASWEKIRK